MRFSYTTSLSYSDNCAKETALIDSAHSVAIHHGVGKGDKRVCTSGRGNPLARMDAQADDRKKLKQIKQLLTEVTTEEGVCKNDLRITDKI